MMKQTMGSNGMEVRTRSEGAFWSSLVVLGIALGLVLVWPSQSSAVPVVPPLVLDISIAEPLDTITSGGWVITGVASGSPTGTTITQTSSEAVTITVPGFNGNNTGNSFRFILHEPTGAVSDVINVSLTSGSLTIAFTSDLEAVLSATCNNFNGTCFDNMSEPASGGFVNLGTASASNNNEQLVPWQNDSNYTTLTLRVQSDASMPEPGSLFLLGSGLVGLAAWRRKQSA